MMALALGAVLLAQSPVVVDRTLAIVNGRTITLSDAKTALVLGLAPGPEMDRDLVQYLVDRELMLREADRYDPPEPSVERVDAGVAEARRRAGGDEALARALEAGGFTEARLRAWVRDDLRVEAYLQQRFAVDDRREDLIADWVSGLRRRAEVVVIP